LVVWNTNFYFSIYWEFHHPNWRTHIFRRGGYTTNQIKPSSPSVSHVKRKSPPPHRMSNFLAPIFFGDCYRMGPPSTIAVSCRTKKWLNSLVYGRYNELVNGDYTGLETNL
jgi:hypothetical protein